MLTRVPMGTSGEIFVDVVNGQLNGGYLLGFFVRNFGFKLLFKGHYQFHRIERISTQVVSGSEGNRSMEMSLEVTG